MNKEKQRIAIAEACGKWPDGWPHSFMNQSDRLRHVPDYLNDLNAMHEAENLGFRSAQQCRDYAEYLDDGNGGHFATATERAEAFLKTIGKWEDDE
jgi:uncharacterized protein YeaC (DUF1315 family)